MRRVKLEISDVSQGVMANNAYFLILRESYGIRKLSVMVGVAEAQSILMAMRGIRAPRPMMHDVYYTSLHTFDMTLREVVIYKVVDGVYYSSLVLVQGDRVERIDARTSDAIALALRFEIPIYTLEDIIARECIHDNGGGSFSIPVSSINEEMLKNALDRAIRDENYELAAQLRDEMNRRRSGK